MKRDTLLWLSGLLTVVLLAGMAWYLRDLKPNLVVAQLTFSREGFESVISSWAPDQVRRFGRHFSVDYVFIVVYAVFGWLLGHRLTGGHLTKSSGTHLLPWLLPAAAAFDCLENMLHQAFLLHRPDGLQSGLYIAAGLAALAKWVLTLLFVALAIRAWRQTNPSRPVP